MHVWWFQEIRAVAGIVAVVLALVVAITVFAFFFLLSISAETALFTESTMSRLCSRYSVSSNLGFFPASSADSPGMAEDEEEPEAEDCVGLAEAGTMPSRFSRVSSFALAASTAAFLRAGSVSRYSASLNVCVCVNDANCVWSRRKRGVLFSFLDGAEPASGEVAARVVVGRLLAAHPTACCTELGAKATIAAVQARGDAEGYEWSAPREHVWFWVGARREEDVEGRCGVGGVGVVEGAEEEVMVGLGWEAGVAGAEESVDLGRVRVRVRKGGKRVQKTWYKWVLSSELILER
jgi:hypothetical protein